MKKICLVAAMLVATTLSGGTLGRFTGTFSWYLNAHMRLPVNYGLGTLEKDGLKGDANFDNSGRNLNCKKNENI